ncbi:lysosomal acid glucosylceramidase-like [Penaeus japonicus]|uniref:lysosomal acid glucosylceramidase-like n=1 Tax=Penaeus japonicus TaxID=27405 RepID=UPI001C70B4E9|nr:lysosomal acid glucosylceramidase-like [Penaeus japonicus]
MNFRTKSPGKDCMSAMVPRQALNLLLLLLLASVFVQESSASCAPRRYEQDSVVCVCDAHHCDLPGRLPFPDPGHYTVVTSSRDGLRFHVETREVDLFGGQEEVPAEDPKGAVALEVDLEDRRQVMLGFGAAFTDASGLSLASLSPGAREMALRSYFSPEGNEYDLGRVPIGSCDFSVKPYSYAEVEGDVDLEYFKLAEEDLLYKIPQLLRAQELSERPLRLLGSPLSPPPWMKTNGKHNESGQLIPNMWRPWADYLLKFVKAYEEEGVPIWGITTQNDPLSGFDPNYRWNSLGWASEDMRDWIKESLGPAIDEAGLQDRLRVIIHDHDRNQLSWYSHATLQDTL